MEIQYSQLKMNHLNNTPSTKAAGGGIFSGVFQQGHQGTSEGREDFELSWYLFFQQTRPSDGCAKTMEVYSRMAVEQWRCTEVLCTDTSA